MFENNGTGTKATFWRTKITKFVGQMVGRRSVPRDPGWQHWSGVQDEEVDV